MLMERVVVVQAAVAPPLPPASSPLPPASSLPLSPKPEEAPDYQAPPPLPPPPPPPPPLLASMCVQRRSMRKVNWDAIPQQRVLGKRNVFTSQLPKRNLELDFQTMEELFSQQHEPQQGPRSLGQKNLRRMSCFSQERRVSILDSKKSMNIGIFLKHFKRPVKEIVEDIRQVNWLRFGADKLKELGKLLPEAGEVKQLQAFNGDVSGLPEADLFMVQLVKVPGYEERLKTMTVRQEFFPLMDDMKNSITIMRQAANELLGCDALHCIIRLVLKAGNYMNAGGYADSTIGFRMVSLLKLADTKANRPGMNLLHYVAKQAQEIDVELLTFVNQLGHIGMASKIQREEVKAELLRAVQEVQEVRLCVAGLPDLSLQMETFLMKAEACLADMESSFLELENVSNAVAEFFCETPAVFKLEECCSVFYSFCQKFDRAVKDNQAREAAELRRNQKESFLNSAKQNTSCSKLQPHPETPGLESVLHTFLSNQPGGPTRTRRSLRSQTSGSSPEPSSQTSPKTSSQTYPKISSQTSPKTSLQTYPNMSSKTSSQTIPKTSCQTYPKISSKTSPKTSPKTSSQTSPQTIPKTVPLLEEGPEGKEKSPDHKQPSVQEPVGKPELRNKEEVKKMREVTEKVVGYQASGGSLSGDEAPDSSPQAERDEGASNQPRVRYLALFNSKGSLDSPWTVLSPSSPTLDNRWPTHRRYSSSGGDLDDEVWLQSPTTFPHMVLLDDEGGKGSGHGPNSPHPQDLTGCRQESSSLPECPVPRTLPKMPALRSFSLDESATAPTKILLSRREDKRFRFDTKSVTESRTEDGAGPGPQKPWENPENCLGLFSFLKRMSDRSKHSGT